LDFFGAGAGRREEKCHRHSRHRLLRIWRKYSAIFATFAMAKMERKVELFKAIPAIFTITWRKLKLFWRVAITPPESKDKQTHKHLMSLR
jgi:hypothetical protein